MGLMGSKAGTFPNSMEEAIRASIDIGPFVVLSNQMEQKTGTLTGITTRATQNFALGPDPGNEAYFIVGGALECSVPNAGKLVMRAAQARYFGTAAQHVRVGPPSDAYTYTDPRIVIAEIPYGWLLMPDDEIVALTQVVDPAAGSIDISCTFSLLRIRL